MIWNSLCKTMNFGISLPQDDIVKIWSENEENIKKVFLSLKFWFDNRKLYHLIGYLISTENNKIEELYNNFKVKTKSDFTTELTTLINESIDINNIETLDYNDDKYLMFCYFSTLLQF